jgi:NAD(P)H dehydrogenase (quinone)
VNVLVVYCHPLEGSFASVLRDHVVASLVSAGHTVDLQDLYAEGFVPELRAEEWSKHQLGPEARPDTAGPAKRLRDADALVLVYPTWWGGLPGMLKGWIDRVWTIGVASELVEGKNRIRGILQRVRSITVVTTHGSTKFVNSLEGEPGKKQVSRQLRLMCGWRTKFNWLAFYEIDRSTPEQRLAFVAKVESRMATL